MGRQLQSLRARTWPPRIWRSGEGEKAWLSMLIDAMEEVSGPEVRGVPCDGSVLAAVRAQLSRPASACAHYGSRFSLRN